MPDTPPSKDPVDQLLDRLCRPVTISDNPFGLPGQSFAELYGMADDLRQRFLRQPATDRSVCLWTEDRAVITAALLAGLTTGVPLVLPHAISEPVLKQLHDVIGFTAAVVSSPNTVLPEGVAAWMPEPTDARSLTVTDGPVMGADDTWIHLFTGGSTGSPRLWSKTPRNLLGEVRYLKSTFQVTPADRILASAPAYHIYGLLYSVLLPLISSAAVLDPSPVYPREIADRLDGTEGISIYVGVPAHYRALKVHPPAGNNLRLAFSSGGPLSPEDGEAFTQATGAPVWEIYGSTETGGIAARCRAAGQTGFVPFACLKTRIDGETLRVKSDFLSPELPFDGDGYFQMADRATGDTINGFAVVGRSDSVVKVAGRRVDLTDVKRVLTAVAGVVDAAVIARPTPHTRENEILAVAAGSASEAQLRRALEAHLEPYARPRAIRIVDRLPVAETGKLRLDAVQRLFQSADGE